MGARQVGKTWLMKNLGRQHFKNFIYVNFEKEQEYRNLFLSDLNVERIIQALSVFANEPIEDGETLIIFDEIQEAPNALTSLKYFAEDRPNLHVIAAGSLLGVALDKGSFPVGKVEFLQVRPMTFEEYLKATGNASLAQLLEQKDFELITTFKDRFIAALRNYYLVGGMPEAVLVYSENRADFDAVRQIQNDILSAYIQDFAKHAPAALIPKIISVWDSLVSQLAKTNKKFIYGLLKSGARAREYEQAIDWLINYGLIHKVYSVNKLSFPLSAYRDLKNFKLYALDVGLLSNMANMTANVIMDNDAFFQEFKGSLTEQFVLQELAASKVENLSYWTNENGVAELDFVFERNGNFYPLEVKATENLQAKSLRIFHEQHPNIHCFRASLSNFREESWMTNVPLYAINKI
jgi:predicted AAA+ superfamily ATPase